MFIIVIIIIIRHELGVDRHVSAWSNSIFKGLPSRLRLFGLQFSISFGIMLLLLMLMLLLLLLLFILMTCHNL